MAQEIKLGRMTDTMEEGFVAELNVKVGDKIKSGDTVAEIETDKATLPLESYVNGVVLHVAAKKGDTLKIGDLIAIVGKEGEDISGQTGGSAGKDKEPKKEEPSQKSKSKESSASKKEDTAKEPAEKESEEEEEPKKKVKEDKSEEGGEVEAPAKETPAKEVKDEKKAKAPAESENEGEEETIEEDGDRIKASPLARSIAKERGIDLSKVKGSGEEGRIVKRDLEGAESAAASGASKPATGKEGSKDVRVSQMRKAIAKRLTESKNSAPHFYLTIEINMDNAVALRTQLNEVLPAKVSFNDIVIKAAALALRQHPNVNASWLGDTIRVYDHIHIGMAVAVEEGLLVPVIRFADTKSVQDIGAEAKNLATKATGKKLSPQEMEGSTFTISNLGMFGIEEFTAIINPPDACILAVGAIQQMPAAVEGQIKVSNRMKLTLSCDHRIVDGASGAKFLQTLKHLLENPVSILL